MDAPSHLAGDPEFQGTAAPCPLEDVADAVKTRNKGDVWAIKRTAGVKKGPVLLVLVAKDTELIRKVGK